MRKYDHKKTEPKWQKRWLLEKVYEPKLKGASRRKKFYNLMMFPYPSAEGLHVGNMYAFTGSDVYGRFKRMQGYDVFQPIGLDGFGIHSENYAMKVGTHPMKQAKLSEKRFYKQLEAIGNAFAWREHLETYDPEYYRWTQWIFVRMWHAGLAYRKKQAVNWCPSCKTVLADEQVIAGKCERCGSVAEKRELEQWFFRITKYAERLLKQLEVLDWSEKVKIAQKHWIGRSEGAEIEFPLRTTSRKPQTSLKIFTTRPDTIFGATYMVLAPEHSEIKNLESEISNLAEVLAYVAAAKDKPEEERMADNKEKTGVVLKGVTAVNPATGEDMPVWVADYVLGGYGTGAIMAVPAHDARDFEFARKFDLPIRQVVLGSSDDLPMLEEGTLISSGQYSGMPSEGSARRMAEDFGTWKTQYRLRDWLISRQRYWGPPIPMIFCPDCAAKGAGERKDMPGWYAEKEKNLPVKLPLVKDFRPKGTGESPLASIRSFYLMKCPVCRGQARRETDVSDTFLDSAWYYLRYPSVSENKSAVNPLLTKKWLPVDMYIGGAEHSVLHLLYVRFMAMVMKDLKVIMTDRTIPKFRAHGLLIKEGAKMSKSKGNVVNPDETIAKFGADTLRMYLMFLAPFEQGGDYRDAGILGVERFLRAVWRYYAGREKAEAKARVSSPEMQKALHKAAKKVSEDIPALKYNTAISALMILWNDLSAAEAGQGAYLGDRDAEMALKLLAPFAPFMTEEIWRGMLGKRTSIHLEAWPKFNTRLIREEMITMAVQVNGRVRATIEVPAGATEAMVKDAGLSDPRVQAALSGSAPRKIIYVPGRILNIVI